MGKYDQAMKLMVAADPQAITEFILHYAQTDLLTRGITVVSMLNTEFEGYEIDADGLLLLHLFCQVTWPAYLQESDS